MFITFKFYLLIFLILFFEQEYTVKAEESISRLNKEVKVEHDGRVAAEKKIESTEEALITLSQENAALQTKLVETQKKLEANDAESQAKLDEIQKKLEASDAELAGLRKMVTDLLASVFGKLKTHLFCLQCLPD